MITKTELTIQFSQPVYTVSETDSRVMICLEARTQPGGNLPFDNTPVLVTLFTDNSSRPQFATGMYRITGYMLNIGTEEELVLMCYRSMIIIANRGNLLSTIDHFLNI